MYPNRRHSTEVLLIFAHRYLKIMLRNKPYLLVDNAVCY